MYPEKLGMIGQDEPYRTSLMAAIWDKQTLISLLKEGENPWEMEIKGTERSRDIEKPFLSVKKGHTVINYFHHVIKKGIWYYDAVKFCEAEGVDIDLNKRRAETHGEYIVRKIMSAPVIGRPLRRIKDLNKKNG
jgi:hypothetical protein